MMLLLFNCHISLCVRGVGFFLFCFLFKYSNGLIYIRALLVLLAFIAEVQNTVAARETEKKEGNARRVWFKSSCKVLLLSCFDIRLCCCPAEQIFLWLWIPPSILFCIMVSGNLWLSQELFLRLIFNQIVCPLSSWAAVSSEAKEAIGVSGWGFGVRRESLQWA